MSDLDQLLQQLADPSGIAWNEETYDLALARSLSAADRATYIARLVPAAQQGDSHAILTLGNIDAQEALAPLQAIAHGGDPWAQVARRALVLLGHGGEAVDAIAHDAVHASRKLTRVAAVMDLGKIGGPVAIAALEQALADADSTVRMLAFDSLVAVLDLDRWMRGPDGQHHKTTQLELIKDFLACDLAAFVRIGVGEMRAITQRLAAGDSPDAIGLAWIGDPAPEVSQQIMQAIVDRDAAFPVADIAKLTGVPRRWAEASLAMRLDQGEPDPRAVDALVALSARWTVPVLEELALAPALSAELRASITHGLGALRTN